MDKNLIIENAKKKFNGELLFSSHDHQFVQTTANRIIELTDNGLIDRMTDYDNYLEEKAKREELEKKLLLNVFEFNDITVKNVIKT